MNKAGKGKKVLVVDDDEFLLEMYVLKFREAGFEVIMAQNGKEAIDKASQHQPDIVLLDIVLPGTDGFEALREIKKKKLSPNSRIVMLTNLGQKDDTEKGMKLGADDYIVKAHFTPSEVVQKIEEMLSK